ncbi:hypothetical protein BRC68_16590 [Halobacteriales archaeon QH_6_64_20]|nr:MAG: hypothetical protein BRC68_16590 [Halobacteriales archaeon QH_6_64_20]
MAIVVCHPLAVLFHGLGHAAVPLLCSNADIEVQLGSEPRRVLTVGRLRLVTGFAGVSLSTGLPGFFRDRNDSLGRVGTIATHLAGPTVTVALFVGTLVAIPRLPAIADDGASIVLLMLGIQAVATLVPIEYSRVVGSLRRDRERRVSGVTASPRRPVEPIAPRWDVARSNGSDRNRSNESRARVVERPDWFVQRPAMPGNVRQYPVPEAWL